MPEPLWFAGVCDSMLRVVELWAANWDRSPAYATRPFMTATGEIEDIVTKRVVQVAWLPVEFEHLVRILKAVRPNWPMTADLERAHAGGFRNCRLLPGGRRLMSMICYKQDALDLFEVLLQAKNGISSLNEDVDKKRDSEAPLWS